MSCHFVFGDLHPRNSYEQLRLFTLMKRRCGGWQGLSKCRFHLQNEIETRWGDSKNEIGFDVHHVYEQNEIKTRPLMLEKCQNLRNEIKTRWGDSVNLPYWGHRTNESRRSYIDICNHLLYPYAPIPSASGFGVGFGYLNTF